MKIWDRFGSLWIPGQVVKRHDWNSLRWHSTNHDLNLDFGVTVQNNFQDKLNMLIDKNPSLQFDDHFYDDRYDEDYFNVY